MDESHRFEDLRITPPVNPELDKYEDEIINRQPGLQVVIEKLNKVLSAQSLDTEQLERYVKIWNDKEKTRGTFGTFIELSGRHTPPQQLGRLRIHYYPDTDTTQIGYKLK